jgi:hypothetical protein
MVAVGAALGPGGAIARAKRRPSLILDQDRFALEHDQKFILAVVPVALRRPGAGLEDDMADAEIRQSRRGCEPAIPTSGDFLVVRRRVSRPVDLFDGVEIDLRHARSIERPSANSRTSVS